MLVFKAAQGACKLLQRLLKGNDIYHQEISTFRVAIPIVRVEQQEDGIVHNLEIGQKDLQSLFGWWHNILVILSLFLFSLLFILAFSRFLPLCELHLDMFSDDLFGKSFGLRLPSP